MIKNAQERDLFFLETIIDALDAIVRHQQSSTPNYTVNRAVILELMTIGEAVTKISAETKQKYPQVDWIRIANTRHKIVHEYFQIDQAIIDNILQQHLPDLRGFVETIINEIR